MKKTLLWLAVVLFLASVPASLFADGNPNPTDPIPHGPKAHIVVVLNK